MRLHVDTYMSPWMAEQVAVPYSWLVFLLLQPLQLERPLVLIMNVRVQWQYLSLSAALTGRDCQPAWGIQTPEAELANKPSKLPGWP
jgi:hypothetical protein